MARRRSGRRGRRGEPGAVAALGPRLGWGWLIDESLRSLVLVALAVAVFDTLLRFTTSYDLFSGVPDSPGVTFGLIAAGLLLVGLFRLHAVNDQVRVADGQLQVVRRGRVVRFVHLHQVDRVVRRHSLSSSASRPPQGYRFVSNEPVRVRLDVPFQRHGDVLDAAAMLLPVDLSRELRDSLAYVRYER